VVGSNFGHPMSELSPLLKLAPSSKIYMHPDKLIFKNQYKIKVPGSNLITFSF